MQNSHIVLSIIIPAYNCEKYIEDCVESILADAPKHLEVLIVDDGSTDKTPTICDALANRNQSVSTLHKKNEGQGIARNYALNYAKGTYVTFVDADDLPTIGAYSEAIELMLEGDYDLGIFRWNLIEHDCTGPIYPRPLSEKKQSTPQKEEVLVDISSLNTQYGSGVWNKIYRRAILSENEIRFHSERNIISEDYLFNFDCLPYCNKIVSADINLYNYRQGDLSYSHKYQENYFDRLERFAAYIEADRRYPAEVIQKTVFKKYSFVKTCIIQEVEHKSMKAALLEIRHICRSQTTAAIIKELNIAELDFFNRIIACLIRFQSAFLLYILYRLKL